MDLLVNAKLNKMGNQEMETATQNYLDNLEIAACQTFANLHCFPLVTEHDSNLDNLILDDASTEDVVSVTKVDPSG